jgi:hypothetical protein
MDSPGSLGEIDLVSSDAVTALGAVAGPCVSVSMPTYRHGPETLQGPVRLRGGRAPARRRADGRSSALLMHHPIEEGHL